MKHGTHPGPLCCDHIREAVHRSTAVIPFGIYRVDISGDGTALLEHKLCTECASRFGLSVDELISEEVWGSVERFPYVCPTCAECFAEWTAPDRLTTKLIGSVQEGLERIDGFVGNPDAFELAVPETLLDPVGINMAILTDRVLGRGWVPDGFVQRSGYRIYRYKVAD
jgi:hypothetical protein